jgi:hypothetical protein
MAAQNRRRRVWKSILTQHLQHLQHLQHKPAAGLTSSTSSVSSCSFETTRPESTALGPSSNFGRTASTAGHDEWFDDVLVTTPLYEDELPVLPWVDSQEQYPDQFAEDSDVDEEE